MKRVLTALSTLALASGLPWILPSCATTEVGSGEQGPPASPLPEAGSTDTGSSDADLADGGCNAADPNCVTKPVTCAEAAWCPTPTNVSPVYTLTAVWGSSKNDVWASGSGASITHWDGTAWKPTPLPPTVKNTFHALWGSSATDVWAISATDMMFHSTGFKSGSATWERAPLAIGDGIGYGTPIYAAWGTSAGYLRLGGSTYGFYIPDEDRYTSGNQLEKSGTDGGVTWTGAEGTALVTGIWGASQDDLWIIGDNSEALNWQLGWTKHGIREAGSGGALTWTEVDSQAAVVLRAVWGSSAADVWAVGDKGTIRRISAADSRWQIVPSPTTETLHAIWGSAPNDVWIAGENGAIFRWDGTSWKASVAAFPVNRKKPDLHAIWGSGPDDVWIVGAGIALHHTGGSK